jgi:hypothetical protein
MTKEFIPYEQALELKALGFDEPCFRWYDERFKDDLHQDRYNTNKDLFMTDLDCSSPLYQQAFKFFRDKNKLHTVVDINISDEWYFSIFNLDAKRNSEVVKKDEYYSTYEEAELACLNKLIEIVKQHKKH